MRKFMHACGGRESVLELKEHGFEAVVGGNQETAGLCAEAGLDFYHCSGAFGADGDDGKLSIDVNGDRRVWFGSACPNNAEIRRKNLENIRKMAAEPHVRGVLIDGARFASPASGESLEQFFTCFCPVCMAKAASLGIDAERMRADAFALYRACKGERVELENHLCGLADWLRFRRITTTEHLLAFCEAVKTAAPGCEAGIYIFTPSLAPLVGQSYADLRGAMDIFSPMIYRCYHSESGPACLNFEYAVIFSALSAALRDPARAADLLRGISGLELPQGEKEIIAGLPVSSVRTEVERAVRLVGREKTVPIIQLDDDLLADSVAACESAAGVNFFIWKQDWFTAAAAAGAI